MYARTDLAREVGARTDGYRLLRVAAAVAVLGPGSAASHRDAAVVHGLPLLTRPPERVAVTRSLDTPGSRALRGRIQIHNAVLHANQVTVRNRIPVTTAARTVVDLARTTPFREGVVVADSALYQRLVTKADLIQVLHSCARWPGIGKARAVVAFSDSRAESPFESITRVALRDGGLPPPDLQIWVGGDEGIIGRVDFLWRAEHTIAEADGALKYADPSRAKDQLRRDAALRAVGYEVVHITWRDLTREPDLVIEAIQAAFARAAALRR